MHSLLSQGTFGICHTCFLLFLARCVLIGFPRVGVHICDVAFFTLAAIKSFSSSPSPCTIPVGRALTSMALTSMAASTVGALKANEFVENTKSTSQARPF